MPIEHALVIAKQGYSGSVEGADPKDRAFDSRLPCLKILDAGKYSFTINTGNTTTYSVTLDTDVAYPFVPLVFLYDPGDSSYKAIGSENVQDHTQNYRGSFWFNETTLYVQVENYTGSNKSTHFIYYITYA